MHSQATVEARTKNRSVLRQDHTLEKEERLTVVRKHHGIAPHAPKTNTLLGIS